MNKILIIGASGFVGGHLARTLLKDGQSIRCLSRDPSRVASLASAGAEVVQGDISDLGSIQRALESVETVYLSIHTLSPQPASDVRQDFMEVERNGLENVVKGCLAQGVRRLISITFLGTAPDAPSAWVRGRWEAEQFLLRSGLDVTVLRPFQIVGVGGHGFEMMVSQARSRVAMVMGGSRNRLRNIAVGDLVYYLDGVRNDPRAYGQCYDVGCDDLLTNDQMIDLAADVLGRPHPIKVHLPGWLLGALAPLIERMTRLPRGAIKGLVDGLKLDAIGDPSPIRAILPRPILSYRQAVEQALTQEKS